MKKLTALFLVLALLVSVPAALAESTGTSYYRTNGNMGILRETRETETPMGSTPWTILVYMCGADLESEDGSATDDLEEILASTAGSNVQVVVQTGGCSEWWSDGFDPDCIQRWVRTGDTFTLVETLPGADMGSADTLAGFVSWGTAGYGAERMGLILWNHGGGSISGVCFDELWDDNSLSLRDLDTALAAAYPDMTDRFEFIGFDACLMGTLETASILVPYARYMYASQETEPSTGWNYTALLNYLEANPSATGRDLAQVQCDSYYEHCDESADTTFSIIDLEKVDALALAFDDAAKEMYESESLSGIARAAVNADNFGGNSRSEGYTNMVDLACFLRAAVQYAPSAQDALNALEEAVVASVNGSLHKDAGGLSVYYPLSVEGSSELSVFRDICTSTYYLALVDKLAYGTTGSDVTSYDNSYIVTESGWADDYEPDPAIGSTSGGASGNECPLPIEDIFIDDEGSYTIWLSDTGLLAYGSCTVMWSLVDGDDEYVIYLGEDDDLIIYWDEGVIQDNFDGTWLWLEDSLLPIELVEQYDDYSLYSCEILLNGEESWLRIAYDWNNGEYMVLGTWEGIDSETGMAGRSGRDLQDGDVIEIVYWFLYNDMEDEDCFLSDPITVNGDLAISYYELDAGEYYYMINLYDIYGNSWQTDPVIFGIEEDGSLYFYE